MRPVVGYQARRHRLEAALEEQIEQQRLDEVVGMMAERDLRRPELCGDAIEHAAAQPGTQRAGRGVRCEQVVHDFADGGVLDMAFPSAGVTGLLDRSVLK